MTTVKKHLIYIVEDDEDDCLFLQEALHYQSADCLIRFFTDGAGLFTQLTHQLDGRLPDLIFLDLDTPVMNGFDTLRLLKQTRPYDQIPVVIRTGHETLDGVNRCYELGCRAYLTKSSFELPPLTYMLGKQDSVAP